MSRSPRCLCRRKISRIFRLARLRSTAFPILREAIIPKRFRPSELGRKNRVQVRSTVFFRPWVITFLKSGRASNRSSLVNDWFTMTQADSRLRPFRLRLASIRRPPTVALRARNPWVRFLRKFFGWYVRFIAIPRPQLAVTN